MHAVKPCWHESEHFPPEHVSPCLHIVPHPPQLVGSDIVLTHAIPHFIVPIPHAVAHAPAMQTSLAAHALPHMPQLRGSLLLSTHSLPHFAVPPPHALAHAPCEQTSPIAHAFPHAPQFCGSRAITVHVPVHSWAPSPQLSPVGVELLLHAAAMLMPSKEHAKPSFVRMDLVIEPSNAPTDHKTPTVSALQEEKGQCVSAS
jgi:hypothetical protein